MQQHLTFIEESSAADYRLDERTKTIGRQGIAAARARLAALAPGDDSHPRPRTHAA